MLYVVGCKCCLCQLASEKRDFVHRRRMGPNQRTAARAYLGRSLAMDSDITTFYSTYSANNEVTDSAAGATALATGHKTNNGYLSISPSGEKLTTILELAKSKE